MKTLEEFDFGRTEKCVRINSVSSGLAEEDLEVLLQSKTLPSSMMLPKVENVEEIRWVSTNNTVAFGQSYGAKFTRA